MANLRNGGPSEWGLTLGHHGGVRNLNLGTTWEQESWHRAEAMEIGVWTKCRPYLVA